MFEHGIEKGVDVSTLDVLEEGSHGEHVEHQGEDLSEKKGLWDNIHAKRKRGEKPAKKGDKDYPKTLNIEGYGMGELTRRSALSLLFLRKNRKMLAQESLLRLRQSVLLACRRRQDAE